MSALHTGRRARRTAIAYRVGPQSAFSCKGLPLRAGEGVRRHNARLWAAIRAKGVRLWRRRGAPGIAPTTPPQRVADTYRALAHHRAFASRHSSLRAIRATRPQSRNFATLAPLGTGAASPAARSVHNRARHTARLQSRNFATLAMPQCRARAIAAPIRAKLRGPRRRAITGAITLY